VRRLLETGINLMIIRVITMVLKKIKDMNLIYNHRSQKIEKIKYPARKPLLLCRLCQEICKFFEF
jgi:hypothetical protein